MAYPPKEPAIKKRGGDPDMPVQPARDAKETKAERELEQGLEESMAGSDPVSVVQPAAPAKHRRESRRPEKRH